MQNNSNETSVEFISTNQFIYTNFIVGGLSLLGCLIVIIVFLKKKQYKEIEYSIFFCITLSNTINAINQFMSYSLIDFHETKVNKKWYAYLQRFFYLVSEFSYAYLSLYYFYFIYQKITTFIDKTKDYYIYILSGILSFSIIISVLFLIIYEKCVPDNDSISHFDNLYYTNGYYLIDEQEKGEFIIYIYYFIFLPPLIFYFIILFRLLRKISLTLKENDKRKINFLNKFYNSIKFLMIYGVLNLALGIGFTIYESIFNNNISQKELFYLRFEFLLSFYMNLFTNTRGIIYFLIFLTDDKVIKIIKSSIGNNKIMNKILKFTSKE